MLPTLTDRQKAIYDFLLKTIREKGFAPSIPEIGKQFKIASTNGVSDHLKALAKSRQYIPLRTLMRWDIRKESDGQKVKIFYLESVSLVDFMIKTYGSSAFGNFCRNLREGKGFEGSLKSAYTVTINSVENLEKKWVEHISR